ncbi:MAG: alpha/beta hydrolase [Rhodospirillaceae bacterium]|nr:alpha/beta hydrolase [Rhodospirillales bacterium]
MAWTMRVAALAVLTALAGCGGAAAPQTQAAQARPNPGAVVTEEFTISAKDDGINLYLLNKHPAEYYYGKSDHTVLFIHGATFPGSATFDLPLEGASWMEWMAKRGYDVYSLDIRGYGKSTRPPAMGQPADANPPAVDGATALRDVSKAVDFILSRRSLDKLVLVGWSWGATLAGAYTAESGVRIDKLVLYAPQWMRDDAPKPNTETKLGAWRTVPLSAIRERWPKDVPANEKSELVPTAWSDTWMNALKASDPDGAAQTPPVLKVPNGVVADWLNTWGAGKPYWRPDRVSVPTLVVQGEWDSETPPEMGLSVFANLTHSPARRYVLIGEGTHTLLLEKNRQQLFRSVQGFLEERY